MTERGWDAVTYDGVRRAQLREQMRLTPSERLRWLEEALRFVALVRRRDSAARFDEARTRRGRGRSSEGGTR